MAGLDDGGHDGQGGQLGEYDASLMATMDQEVYLRKIKNALRRFATAFQDKTSLLEHLYQVRQDQGGRRQQAAVRGRAGGIDQVCHQRALAVGHPDARRLLLPRTCSS